MRYKEGDFIIIEPHSSDFSTGSIFEIISVDVFKGTYKIKFLFNDGSYNASEKVLAKSYLLVDGMIDIDDCNLLISLRSYTCNRSSCNSCGFLPVCKHFGQTTDENIKQKSMSAKNVLYGMEEFSFLYKLQVDGKISLDVLRRELADYLSQ